MKLKTTRKQIENGYTRILAAGYCELYYLLRAHEPIAATYGIYGWNFDLYDIDGVAICTGYRRMAGKRAEHGDEYNQKAEKIWNDKSLTYEEAKTNVNNLLDEFIKVNFTPATAN